MVVHVNYHVTNIFKPKNKKRFSTHIYWLVPYTYYAIVHKLYVNSNSESRQSTRRSVTGNIYIIFINILIPILYILIGLQTKQTSFKLQILFIYLRVFFYNLIIYHWARWLTNIKIITTLNSRLIDYFNTLKEFINLYVHFFNSVFYEYYHY